MYTLTLDHSEVTALDWLSGRYRYAEILFDALDGETGLVELPEPDAWDLAESVESGEDGGYLPCAGGTLAEKIEGLLLSII